ncbi:unnamed protein product [Owenia fusiformis]|uniref:Uncharacterized protein n=1 Tax=Owenia fusiformis TaxID=6347 RepID=A0A8S4NZF8_OWEFU|nr:unnamed protein product [Owenia fusiformis]
MMGQLCKNYSTSSRTPLIDEDVEYLVWPRSEEGIHFIDSSGDDVTPHSTPVTTGKVTKRISWGDTAKENDNTVKKGTDVVQLIKADRDSTSEKTSPDDLIIFDKSKTPQSPNVAVESNSEQSSSIPGAHCEKSDDKSSTSGPQMDEAKQAHTCDIVEYI